MFKIKIIIPFIPYKRACGKIGRYQLIIAIDNTDHDDTWEEIRLAEKEGLRKQKEEKELQWQKELRQGLRKCPGHKDKLTKALLNTYDDSGKCYRCGGYEKNKI